MNAKGIAIAGCILVLIIVLLWIWGTSGPVGIRTEQGTIIASGDEKSGRVIFTPSKGKEGFDMAFKYKGLVNNFPADIPIYYPSRVDVSNLTDGGKNAAVLLVTPDSVKKVAEFYREAVPQMGWTVVKDDLVEQFAEGMYRMDASKGDYGLRVTVSVAGDGTNIALGKEILEK